MGGQVSRRKLKPPARRGRAPLLDDPQRFALALWVALERMKLGPIEAARLSSVLVESDDPIAIEAIANLLVVVSSTFDPKTTTLERHAEWMARKSRRIFERATDIERRWALQSAGAVEALIRFSAANNRSGMKRALALLDHAGWRDVIERLQRRVGGALRTNMPDFENELGRLGRALLKSVGQKAARDQALLK
jgi:hypothetical protein